MKSHWLKLRCSDRKQYFTEFTTRTWLHLSNLPPPRLTCSLVSQSQSAGWSWGRCAGMAPAPWWSSDSSDEEGTPVDIRGRWCNLPRWHRKHLRTLMLWHRQEKKLVIDCKTDKTQKQFSKVHIFCFIIPCDACRHLFFPWQASVKPYKSCVTGAVPRAVIHRMLLHLLCFFAWRCDEQ